MKNEEKKVLNEKSEKSEKKELNDKDIEQVTGGIVKLDIESRVTDRGVRKLATELAAELAVEAVVEGVDLPTSNAY